MVGRQLSRYRIVEEVGSGGMAVVYRGLDTSLDREVAVKVLHPHLAGREESRKRFSREAQAVAKLHHPNILEIYDYSGGEQSESFIVTEFIRGRTLRQLVEAHPFKPPEVAMMAVHELAGALEHAHEIGVIHRDIKPENVMIREDGCLKLTDFGIAKILDRDEKMTLTGALVGSPAHMAPEIIEGDEAGPEADIFSLGTILYWLGTGKLPFFASNTTATLKRILDGQYDDPRTLNPQISDGMAEVIARCLARDPHARFPTAAALRERLAALLNELGIERPGEEFALFYADPAGAAPRLTARIVAALLECARTSAAAGNGPRAMAAIDRVLALAPDHAEAHELLGSLRRRARRRKRLLAGAWTAVALGALTALGAGARHAWNRKREAPPIAVVEAPKPKPSPPAVVEPQPVRTAPPPSPSPAPAPATRSSPPPPRTVAAVTHEPVHREPVSRGRPGSVLIAPRPYADIYIDGRKVSESALDFTAQLPPGAHSVRLEHPASVTETVTVQIPEGGRAPDVRVRMQPLPAHLRVENGQNAGVVVDGKLMGTSGMSLQNAFLVPMALDPSGQPSYRTQVRITLTKPGFKDATVTRELRAGETATVNQELEPQ